MQWIKQMTELMNSWQDCGYNRHFFYKNGLFLVVVLYSMQESGCDVNLWVKYPFNLLLQIPWFFVLRWELWYILCADFRWSHIAHCVHLNTSHLLSQQNGSGWYMIVRVKEQRLPSLFLSFFNLEFSSLSCCSHLSCCLYCISMLIQFYLFFLAMVPSVFVSPIII